MTRNFQKLLKQATNEIKKLKSDNVAIEEEQDKLLDINQELSREMEKLVIEKENWEVEREGLLKANEEFVEEVKKLYIEKEQWKAEKSSLIDKRNFLEEEFMKDKNDLQERIRKERDANIEQIAQLNNSLAILNKDNTNLKVDIAGKVEQNQKTEEELKKDFEE